MVQQITILNYAKAYCEDAMDKLEDYLENCEPYGNDEPYYEVSSSSYREIKYNLEQINKMIEGVE